MRKGKMKQEGLSLQYEVKSPFLQQSFFSGRISKRLLANVGILRSVGDPEDMTQMTATPMYSKRKSTNVIPAAFCSHPFL